MRHDVKFRKVRRGGKKNGNHTCGCGRGLSGSDIKEGRTQCHICRAARKSSL